MAGLGGRPPGQKDCSATTRSGAPCKGWAVSGGLCMAHGPARNPVSELKSMLGKADRMAARLQKMIDKAASIRPIVVVGKVKSPPTGKRMFTEEQQGKYLMARRELRPTEAAELVGIEMSEVVKQRKVPAFRDAEKAAEEYIKDRMIRVLIEASANDPVLAEKVLKLIAPEEFAVTRQKTEVSGQIDHVDVAVTRENVAGFLARLEERRALTAGQTDIVEAEVVDDVD